MLSRGKFEKRVKEYQAAKARGGVIDDNFLDLEPYRVKNAIIMAAGMSSRFVPLSYEYPKALLRVKGEILIERQICQLKAVGINDITIVVGYMKEKLFYLADKFNVKIIVNENYYKYNNTSTLMLVKDKLDNTYICSSDNYFSKNPFEQFVYRAYYSAVYSDGDTSEYCLKTDTCGRINDVRVGGADAWYMLGHVYFDHEFSKRFVDILVDEYKHQSVKESLWEDVYRKHLDLLTLYIRKYSSNDIYEFDSLEELRAFDPKYLSNAGSTVLNNICSVLDCEEKDIQDIVPIKTGMTNMSFCFICKGTKYIYRHPGKGTSAYIDRASEAASMNEAKRLGLDTTYIHMNPDKGWKISYFIDGVKALDYRNRKQVEKAFRLLNRLHAKGKDTKHEFPIWQEIQRFYHHIRDNESNTYDDLFLLHELVQSLYQKLIAEPHEYCLCHCDCYAPNFLVAPDGKVILIDWEYSGMADPAVDFGTFVTCSNFDVDEVKELLKLYLADDWSLSNQRHYLGYIVICSYYWFLWALFQESSGKDIGQYTYEWYRHTKEYAKIVKHLYD